MTGRCRRRWRRRSERPFAGNLLPVLRPDVTPDKPIPLVLTNAGRHVTENVVPERQGEA